MDPTCRFHCVLIIALTSSVPSSTVPRLQMKIKQNNANSQVIKSADEFTRNCATSHHNRRHQRETISENYPGTGNNLHVQCRLIRMFCVEILVQCEFEQNWQHDNQG